MPRPAVNALRATVSLREPDVDNLDEVARATRLSRNDAIRKSLATEAFIQEVLSSGGKLYVQDSEGNMNPIAWVN